MNIRQEFIISYDISNTKDRTSLYNVLMSYGLFPVQKSVFWGMLTKAERNAISRHIEESLQEDDKALIVTIKIDLKDNRTQIFGYSKEDFQDWKNNDVI